MKATELLKTLSEVSPEVAPVVETPVVAYTTVAEIKAVLPEVAKKMEELGVEKVETQKLTESFTQLLNLVAPVKVVKEQK